MADSSKDQYRPEKLVEVEVRATEEPLGHGGMMGAIGSRHGAGGGGRGYGRRYSPSGPSGGSGGGSGPTSRGGTAPSFQAPSAYSGRMPESAESMGRDIIAAAEELGVDPVDLATVIGYETGGTYDPWQRGPTTRWGTHRGLIQFGEPQARQYGAYRGQSFGEQVRGPVVSYLKDRGLKPGMGLLDIYSTINAGAPGRYDWSDRPGATVESHVRSMLSTQPRGHRAKAAAIVEAGRPKHKGEPPSPNQPQPVYPEGSPLREEAVVPDISPSERELIKRADYPRGPYQTILPTTVTPYKRTTMTFPADQHSNRNSVRRVTVYQVDDSKPQQTIWAKGLYQEEIKFAYRQQGFGLSTVPPEGSEGMAFEIAGRPDQMFFLESEHKDYRPVDKKPGESVLYDANGNTISLVKDSNGGQIEIKIDGAGKVHLKGAEDVTVESTGGALNLKGEGVSIDSGGGNVSITGDVNQTGDMNTTGVHTDANGHHA